MAAALGVEMSLSAVISLVLSVRAAIQDYRELAEEVAELESRLEGLQDVVKRHEEGKAGSDTSKAAAGRLGMVVSDVKHTVEAHTKPKKGWFGRAKKLTSRFFAAEDRAAFADCCGKIQRAQIDFIAAMTVDTAIVVNDTHKMTKDVHQTTEEGKVYAGMGADLGREALGGLLGGLAAAGVSAPMGLSAVAVTNSMGKAVRAWMDGTGSHAWVPIAPGDHAVWNRRMDRPLQLTVEVDGAEFVCRFSKGSDDVAVNLSGFKDATATGATDFRTDV